MNVRHLLTTCSLIGFSQVGFSAELEEQYIGTLYYGGGYDDSVGLRYDVPTLIKTIRIVIPDLCPDVEALEVRTTSDEIIYEVAQFSESSGRFLVNGGVGHHIARIKTILNGPHGQPCPLPVYAE